MDAIRKEIEKIVMDEVARARGAEIVKAANNAINEKIKAYINGQVDDAVSVGVEKEIGNIRDIVAGKPVQSLTELLIKTRETLLVDVDITGDRGAAIGIECNSGDATWPNNGYDECLRGATNGKDRVDVPKGKYRMLLMFIPREED